MAKELLVPTLGESVVEATVAKWMKKSGENVNIDEAIVELETEKVTLEVPAPISGVLQKIVVEEGSTVEVGSVLGFLVEGSGTSKVQNVKNEIPSIQNNHISSETESEQGIQNIDNNSTHLSPAVKRLITENNLSISNIHPTGKDGRITKGDVLEAIKNHSKIKDNPSEDLSKIRVSNELLKEEDQIEERVPMSRLRKVIASRLKQAQNTAAMLTTFNEVDMSALMNIRSEYRDLFEKKHGIRLGFMGMFVKASISALKDFPAVNAEISGEDIIYKKYNNIGVAVGTPNGLVVPVIRDAHKMGLAEIEKNISDLGLRARDGKIGMDELSGGTFTISNGGVYGSLMSTPILNPPQSGILGMHKIQKRPVAVEDEIVVRPMMYLALSYDHRIIDGREAVSFLVKIKEVLEDPRRLILEV